MAIVELLSDKVQVTSNLVGDNNKITLHVGSYQLSEIAKLLSAPLDGNIKVVISWED